jgi:hypothetical protein
VGSDIVTAAVALPAEPGGMFSAMSILPAGGGEG